MFHAATHGFALTLIKFQLRLCGAVGFFDGLEPLLQHGHLRLGGIALGFQYRMRFALAANHLDRLENFGFKRLELIDAYRGAPVACCTRPACCAGIVLVRHGPHASPFARFPLQYIDFCRGFPNRLQEVPL